MQKISPVFSFMVFDYNSYVKVVILGNLCGGPLQDHPRRVSREISPSRPRLSEYPRFLWDYAKFICVPLFFSEKMLVWMAGARISLEKGLSGWLGRVFLEKEAGLDGCSACQAGCVTGGPGSI